jgi:hypothetical protein
VCLVGIIHAKRTLITPPRDCIFCVFRLITKPRPPFLVKLISVDEATDNGQRGFCYPFLDCAGEMVSTNLTGEHNPGGHFFRQFSKITLYFSFIDAGHVSGFLASRFAGWLHLIPCTDCFRANPDVKRDRISKVLDGYDAFSNVTGQRFNRYRTVYSYPSALINDEVVVGVPPHAKRDNGITYSGDERDPLKPVLPPWRGLIPAVAELFCGMWGWLELRRGRGETTWLTIAFFGGIIRHGYFSFAEHSILMRAVPIYSDLRDAAAAEFPLTVGGQGGQTLLRAEDRLVKESEIAERGRIDDVL